MREGLLELHDVVRMQLPVPMQADRAVLHMAQVTVEAQVQACTCTASTRLRTHTVAQCLASQLPRAVITCCTHSLCAGHASVACNHRAHLCGGEC